MGHYQQITSALSLAACFALSGCVHNRPEADAKLKPDAKAVAPAADPDAPKSPAGMKAPEVKVDPAVKQASATIPAQTTSSIAALAKFAGKNDTTKGAASQLAFAWQNRISYQANVAQNGEMMSGLVGQMFLYTPGFQPAVANGKLVIEMFEDNGRSDSSLGTRIGGWTLDKETLKKLVLSDEQFGKCYALYLPWPDYKAEKYGRVKLTGRYEPEHGYPLFARVSSLTIDNTDNQPIVTRSSQTLSPGAPIPAGFMGPPPGAQMPPNFVPPPLNPVPIGGRSATGLPGTPDASNVPPNLPPLVITAGGK